jgi:hypothetical protein
MIMKNKIVTIIITVAVSLGLTSCMDKTDNFAPKLGPVGDILFAVDPSALPAALSTMEQPSFNVGAITSTASSAVRFSKTGNAVVTVSVSNSKLTNLTVNYIAANSAANGGGVISQTRSTLTFSDGSVQWTYPMNTLGLNNAPVTTTVVLQFVASNDDGSLSTSRMLQINAF